MCNVYCRITNVIYLIKQKKKKNLFFILLNAINIYYRSRLTSIVFDVFRKNLFKIHFTWIIIYQIESNSDPLIRLCTSEARTYLPTVGTDVSRFLRQLHLVSSWTTVSLDFNCGERRSSTQARNWTLLLAKYSLTPHSDELMGEWNFFT